MKFISGIKKGEFKTDDNDKRKAVIHIPAYHRTSIGFTTGSKVFYICKKELNSIEQNRELILTTIEPYKWHLIRKLVIETTDGIGVIHSVARALEELSINVHIEEAITVTNEKHSLTFIIDLNDYLENHCNDAEKTNEPIKDAVINDLKDSLVKKLGYKNREDIQINKLNFLHDLSNTAVHRKTHHLPAERYSKEPLSISHGYITINSSETSIQSNLNLGENFCYTLFSDTEEKYVKVLFLRENGKYIYIDVYHANEPGAIAKFTEIISNYNCNILASYNNQQIAEAKAHWVALIDVTKRPNEVPLVNILNGLMSATYANGEGSTEQVFLIETNFNVDKETIIKYGQIKRDEDGEYTSIYLEKKKILRRRLNYLPWQNEDSYIEKFIEDNGLRESTTQKDYIRTLIRVKYNNRSRWLSRSAIVLGATIIFSLLYWGMPPAYNWLEGVVQGTLIHWIAEHTVAKAIVFIATGYWAYVNGQKIARKTRVKRRGSSMFTHD